MDIRKELEHVWPEIVKVGNITGNIGTGLQDCLHDRIRRLLPETIDYYFDFNMYGFYEHIFYEKNNPQNTLTF